MAFVSMNAMNLESFLHFSKDTTCFVIYIQDDW